MKTPEMYDQKCKAWDLKLLPIVPAKWSLFVKPEAKEQFNVIKNLIQKADILVHAADPDKEGQLIVDEILEYVNNKKPVQRILLNALDKKSIRAALNDLRDNKDFAGLKKSALARSRADWLVGYNLTRAYTKMAERAGYSGVMRIGRVKTPTMALVVRREREIRNFKAKKHYKLEVVFQHKNGPLKCVWQPDKDLTGLDNEGRLLQRADAENALKKIKEIAEIKISECLVTNHNQNQRLPYSLSALQIGAGKKYGYSPKAVLEAAQKLYEAKFTTYPRSDCDYLPVNQLSDAETVLANLSQLPKWQNKVAKADISIRSHAWNDKKISAHHAIIPTTLPCDITKLTEVERNIYLMIATAYLAQFYSARSYDQTKLTVTAGEFIFASSGKAVKTNGWKDLYTGEDDDTDPLLPVVEKDDTLTVRGGEIYELITKPPARFTTATLLEAMKNVHRYLRDPDYIKSMKTISGIGTEATRAAIIDELISSGLLQQNKKALTPCEAAEKLFDALTDGLTYPDMTALWEERLARITTDDFSYESFYSASVEMIELLLKEALAKEISPPENRILCPACGKALTRLKGKNDAFWKCASCAITFKDAKGKPAIFSCPECKEGLLVRRHNKAKDTYFWGCSRYPECKAVFSDKNGRPNGYP
jgi:DNA topoisomerase-3